MVRLSGTFDWRQRGILTLIKSVETEKFFEFKVPNVTDKMVRMSMPKGFNFFQYIDENTTKYIGYYNADP